jgi:hypothetical protein
LKSAYFLLVLVCFFCAPHSFAAFPVRHAATEDHHIITFRKTGNTTESLAGKHHSPAIRLSGWLHQKSAAFFPVRRKTDVHGLLSLIFGIIGVIPLFGIYFCIPAVILGAVGVSRNEPLALTGLILGIIGVAIAVLIIIAIVE